MYSAPFPCFLLRAARFLLPGNENCSISILHDAVSGSCGSSGDGWPLQAPVSNMHHTCEQTECANARVASSHRITDHMLILMSCALPSAHFCQTILLVLGAASPQKHGYWGLMGLLCMASSVTMATMFHGEVPAQRSLQHGEDSNHV